MIENTQEYKRWQQKRNRNTYISYFLIFLGGIEGNAVSVTLLYYLNESFGMTADKLRMYYSIAEMCNGLGQISSGLLVGRYMDRTRELRFVVLFILWVTVIGNLLYALPFNMAFIIIGRFFCGFNEAFQVALCGRC